MRCHVADHAHRFKACHRLEGQELFGESFAKGETFLFMQFWHGERMSFQRTVILIAL